MINILLAFVTGLTTGGLSCLAVQGGLLASSLANQMETALRPAAGKNKKGKSPTRPAPQPEMAPPILAFLAAKLLAYTVLGFLLGLVGQMFQLSLFARAFLQIAIGIFMLGTALRMLNVHPIFRYFAFEPPAFLRRRLRKAAAGQGESLAAPAFVGLLTVLIPCGVTQAMLATALASGSPAEGAALMFAFTLGTSPVFFAVVYFATQLGKKLELRFMQFVAVVVLLLALVSIDSGLTLAGAPVSGARLLGRVLDRPASPNTAAAAPLPGLDPAAAGPQAPTADPASGDESVITLTVENYGYSPDVLTAPAGKPVRLRLVSQGVRSCALAFVIPALNYQQILESTGETYVDIPPQEPGTRMPFSCSMGMYGGEIYFEG